MKNVDWQIPLKTPQQRAIFSGLIQRGIAISFSPDLPSSLSAPRENENVKADIIHCLSIAEYFLKDPHCLPEIAQWRYIGIVTLAIKQEVLEQNFTLSKIPPHELKKLLPLFIPVKKSYKELIYNLLNLLEINDLETSDRKHWVQLAQSLVNEELYKKNIFEKIVAHFDKLNDFLIPNNQKIFAIYIVRKPCAFEFFEPSIRILINNLIKFTELVQFHNFVKDHIGNFLKFFSIHLDNPITKKADNLLISIFPNRESSFIMEVLKQGFEMSLPDEQEQCLCHLYEKSIALPKKSPNLPAPKSKTLTKKIHQICEKHLFFPPFILPWILEFAINSSDPIKGCVEFVERFPVSLSEPLNKEVWDKIFSKPFLRQAVVNHFLENSIFNGFKSPSPLIEVFARYVLVEKTDPAESRKEITTFIRLVDKLFVPFENDPASNLTPTFINLPPPLIKPLLEVLEKENLVSQYSRGVSRLLGQCLVVAFQQPEIISRLVRILKQIAKAKKESTSKEEKNRYKSHMTFIYNSLAIHIPPGVRPPSESANIFLFCQTLILEFKNDLLQNHLNVCTNIFIDSILDRINEQTPLIPELIENLSSLILAKKERTPKAGIKNKQLADTCIKKFISNWKNFSGSAIITTAILSMLVDCLEYPRTEDEQKILSEILSNFGLLSHDVIPPSNSPNFSQNPLFCRLLLERWKGHYLPPNIKYYVYRFIRFINQNDLFEVNKENILRIINATASNTIKDFEYLFPVKLTDDQLSYISSQLVNKQISVPQIHNKLREEQDLMCFILSRYHLSPEGIKLNATEFAQIEIILPPGGENLKIEQYVEHFKLLDPKIVDSHATSELKELAGIKEKTCYQLILSNLENVIKVLNKREKVELSPDDPKTRENFYGVIIRDLQASLFHINSKLNKLNKQDQKNYLNSIADVFTTLAEAKTKVGCIYPYQTAAQSIYRRVVPAQAEIGINTIEQKMTRKVLEFLWESIYKVIALDSKTQNVHKRNAYIKFFEEQYGPQIGSTKVIEDDPILKGELAEVKKSQNKINSDLNERFNFLTILNAICENWGNVGNNSRDRYSQDDLNLWVEEYSKKNNLNEVPYQFLWSKKSSIPWPGLLQVLNTLGIFEKGTPDEKPVFNPKYVNNNDDMDDE